MAVDAQALHVFREACFDTPPFPFIVDAFEVTSDAQAIQERVGVGQHRLLLDRDDAQPRTNLQVAVFQRYTTRQYAQERGLTGAITTDQPDPFALDNRERGAIKQWRESVGQLPVNQGDQRRGHDGSVPDDGVVVTPVQHALAHHKRGVAQRLEILGGISRDGDEVGIVSDRDGADVVR